MEGDLQTDTTALLTTVGGGLAILGAIFPWKAVPAAGSQYGIEGLGVLTAGLGALAIGFGFVATDRRIAAATMAVGVAIGAAGSATMLSMNAPVGPRIGVLMTLVAGALVVFGGGHRYLDELSADSDTSVAT